MKKLDALELALTCMHDQHSFVVGEDGHEEVAINCDCSYGKSIRKLIRTVGKKREDEFKTMFQTMPVLRVRTSAYKKKKRKISSAPAHEPELVGV